MLIAVAEGTEAIIQAQTYKALSDKQGVEIERKEAVIINQIDKNKISYRLIDTLKMQSKIKDEIIIVQASKIKKLDRKPKTWKVILFSFIAGVGAKLLFIK